MALRRQLHDVPVTLAALSGWLLPSGPGDRVSGNDRPGIYLFKMVNR
jgi:hypothetical protein